VLKEREWFALVRQGDQYRFEPLVLATQGAEQLPAVERGVLQGLKLGHVLPLS